MMGTAVTASEWARKFKDRKNLARYGAREVDIPPLTLDETRRYMQLTHIHEGVLSPLRRAAVKLDWFIMVRPIKPTALFHCGDYDKLPKPSAIKTKCHPVTGMVMFENRDAMKKALAKGRVNVAYAKANGLHLDPTPTVIPGRATPLHYLMNGKGQRYYSDMDLYEVLNGSTGRRVILGTGDKAKPFSGANWRRELDILINVLRPLGTDFALIDHGPQRQWVNHKHHEQWHEPISVFCPDGKVFVLAPANIEGFIASVGA